MRAMSPARGASRLLEPPAAAADDDCLVLTALHQDQGVDHGTALRLDEPFNLHGEAVGQLLAEPADKLFANDLGREERLAPIGEVVLRVYRRTRPACAP